MSHEFGVQRKQNERRQYQHHRGKPHRQQVQSENCQQYKNYSHRSRQHRPWMIEFREQCHRSHRQQDERDIWVHNERQNVLLQGHIEVTDRLSCQLERDRIAVEPSHRPVLNLLHQIFFTGSHIIDKVF